MQDLIKEIKCFFGEVREHNITYTVEDIMHVVEGIITRHVQAKLNKTVVERVQEERDDLAKKFDKLSILMNDKEKFSKISANQQKYLADQYLFMHCYLHVLDERLEDFAKNEGTK